MIDPDSDRAAYLQIADQLKELIASGKLKPGQKVPSEPTLMQQHSVSRNTVRNAVAILRREGLVVVRAPAGTFVRDPGAPRRLILHAGEEVRVRIPTNAERREHDLAEGVQAMVVTRADGSQQIYPADVTRVIGWSTEPDTSARRAERSG